MIFRNHPLSVPLSFCARQGVRLLCLLVLAIGLTGCMDYDLGIQFKNQTSGAIVQHIHLDRMTTLGSVTLEQWFESLEQRTQQLQGYSRHPSPQDLELTLPFVNGADLVQKFNQLFADPDPSTAEIALFPMSAHLELTQQNALLALRNHLDLTIDLRELGGITPQGEQLFDTDSLLHLKVFLQTPWGAQWQDSVMAQVMSPDNPDRSALQSGQLNHLQATFWIPSPIGIGSVVILAIVAMASFVHQKLKLSA